VLPEPGDGRIVSWKWINRGEAVMGLMARKLDSAGLIIADFIGQLY